MTTGISPRWAWKQCKKVIAQPQVDDDGTKLVIHLKTGPAIFVAGAVVLFCVE